MSNYGTIAGADTYFNEYHMNASDWINKTDTEKTAALHRATIHIEQLKFIGMKTPAYNLYNENPNSTAEELIAAAATQELSFPRGGDTVVPAAIEKATYELAYALLVDEIDPEREFDNAYVNSQNIGGVRLTSSQAPPPNVLAGIPSMVAWNYLKPFLVQPGGVKIRRVS